MKYFCYFIVKCVYTLYPKSWHKHYVQGIWAALGIVNFYLVLFFFVPIINIIYPKMQDYIISNKYNSLWIIVPLMLLQSVYFFWDDRYERIYKEISEMPANERKKGLATLLRVFIVYTLVSITFIIFNFYFDRW